MIGLDTNVLVRYLTQDDPFQSALANSVFDNHLTKDKPGFVSLVVLCELIWVLEVCYKQGRAEIAKVIEQVLRVAELLVESSDVVQRALADFREGNADFSDNLIACLNLTQGCDFTYTFDKRASKQPGFVALTRLK